MQNKTRTLPTKERGREDTTQTALVPGTATADSLLFRETAKRPRVERFVAKKQHGWKIDLTGQAHCHANSHILIASP